MSELEIFKSKFPEVKFRFFWLTTLVVFLKMYLWDWIDPSKERYWKKILADHRRLAGFYEPLERLDNFILGAFPWLGRYCWNVVVWCRK